MEAIIFCGIQATGKSTSYIKNFFNTHIRISMDQLNTRNKENIFINTCLNIQQPFVIDNTNPTRDDRIKYIEFAKAKKYKIVGYYFQSNLDKAIERNISRIGNEKIPEVGIRGTFKKLELPSREEGFDELYYVEIVENKFIIKNWQDEV